MESAPTGYGIFFHPIPKPLPQLNHTHKSKFEIYTNPKICEETMVFFAKSDRGRVREENQDSYGISEAQGKYLLAVVCDGMGGAAGGKMAAKLASSTYLDKFAFFYSDRFDDGEEQIVTPFEIKRIFSNWVPIFVIFIQVLHLWQRNNLCCNLEHGYSGYVIYCHC